MGLLKKIARGAKKVVRKVVPKELSGIMTAAAPFVAPVSLPAAAALSIAGQLRTGQGRINPILTGASLLPGLKFSGSAQGLGRFVPKGFAGGPGGEDLISARQLFFGGPGRGESGVFGKLGDQAEGILFGKEGIAGGNVYDTEGRLEGVFKGVKPTRGILGEAGKFDIGQGTLIRKDDGRLNKTNIAGLVGAGLSLTQINNQIEEEGEEVGLSESSLDALKAEAADIFKDFDTTAFRPQVTAAIGGLMRKNLSEGSKGKMASDPTIMSTLNDLSIDIFGKPYFDLTEREQLMLQEFAESGKPGAAVGGLMRTNYALGSRPTAQESGLGGLPIEADMRYTGGFMPYGAREKADDVPARLSKNEFVFTADAVRAAGGGNINKGARRMYNTMKQLESMGRA